MGVIKKTMSMTVNAQTVIANFNQVSNNPGKEFVKVKQFAVSASGNTAVVANTGLAMLKAQLTSDPNGTKGLGASAGHTRFFGRIDPFHAVSGTNFLVGLPDVITVNRGEDVMLKEHLNVVLRTTAEFAAAATVWSAIIIYEDVKLTDAEMADYSQRYGL